MADTAVSQLVPVVKHSDDIHFLSIGSMPAVLSTDVARHFQKKHTNVLRDIDRLRSILPKTFVELNFELMFRVVEAGDGATRKVRLYALTRDALSLLVMGMTGKAAIIWKLRYIEAFNAMEARLRDMAALGGAEASSRNAIRESGYKEGYDAGRAATLPEVKAAEEEARQKTARQFWRLGPARKRRVRTAVRYRKMGLGIAAMAKLLDVDNREISNLLDAAEALGELPPRRQGPARPVQGNLLTDGVASGSELTAKAARSSRPGRVNRDATPERGKEVEA